MIKDIVLIAKKTPAAPPVYFNEVWTAGQGIYGELGINISGFGQGRSFHVQVGSDTNWSSVSPTANTVAAIKTDGTLWAWGRNLSGDVGDGTTSDRSSPVQIGSDTNWKLARLPFGLKTDGTLWSWGRGLFGYLGQNDTINRSYPTQIGTDTDWKDVVSQNYLISTACAIKTDGTLWVWGPGLYSGLSRDGRLPGIVFNDFDYANVRSYSNFSMGESIGFAISFDGKLWGWGNNADNVLGDGNNTARSIPIQIGTDTDWSIVKTPSSGRYSMAIKTDGKLWGWGTNESGQLGLLDTTSRSIAVQIGTGSNWSKVSVGFDSTIALKTDGTMWSWGSNSVGQLGLRLALTANRSSPVQIGTRSDWTQISSGYQHHLAIRSDGTLWAWGNGSNRQLGITSVSTVNRSSPTQVGVLSNWSQVAAGRLHSMAIASDGTLWTWGGNTNGQLGLSVTTGRSSPVQVGTRSDWTQISAGNNSSFGILTDKTLWSWGLNSSGELGLGDTITRSSPTQIGTLTNWASSSMGLYHAGFLNENGVLYTNGRYGLGTSADNGIGRVVIDGTYRSSPIQLGSDTDWEKFSGDYAVLKKTNGTHWAIPLRSSPIKIGTDTDWETITAGDSGYPAFGIKTNGTLWQWTSSNLTSYSQSFGTDTNWKSVSTSGNGPFTLFTKTDGTAWFYGSNSNNQAGIGSNTSFRSSPVQIGTLSSWVSASAGATITALIKRYT